MRIFSWLLRAFIFFTLFAFALNNQHTVRVNWFFGVNWNAPMVFMVLAAFAAGCALGALAMLPGWWKSRQSPAAGAWAGAATAAPGSAVSPPGAAAATTPEQRRNAPATAAAPSSEFGADHPSRLGV